MFYLGIDVSKSTLDVCLVDAQGSVIHECQVTNESKGFSSLKSMLKKHVVDDAVKICMEATGIYSDAVALYLHDEKYEVSIVNPAWIKAYANSQLQRNKTDKVDARLIADFVRTQAPRAWNPPSEAWNELRALVRHLGDLEQVKQQMINRRDSASSSMLLEYLNKHIDYLDQQMEAVLKSIYNHLQ